MASVTLSSISKTYEGEVHAVNDVSLEVFDGEFLVLLGPSGCGKSTILRAIAGLESVTKGTIEIGGDNVTDTVPKHRNVAMVFQNYALYPHMTVAQNIGFGLKLRGLGRTKINSEVQETARLLGLTAELDRRPGELSGGQRQRVALGRAIVRNPAVFLFDEPLSNLDARLRTHMRLEIAKLHKRLGTTMIYVTHDQVEAMTMGDRIVIMNQGEILQIDTPLGIYNNPTSLFVASFIGNPSINLLSANRPSTDSRDVILHDSHGVPPLHEVASVDSSLTDLVVGIRPENITIQRQGNAKGPNILPGIVEVVEPLGNETIVHVRVGEVTVVARVSSKETVSEDEAIELSFNTNDILLFDPSSGKRL